MPKGRFLLALLLIVTPGFPQAVTQGRTTSGLPWGVMELAGGDGEWAAVWLPPTAQVPEGWEEKSAPQGKVATAWFPALAAPVQLSSAVSGIQSALAVMLVGPVPARELALLRAQLESVSPVPIGNGSCTFADGVMTVLRETKEGFRWRFPLPPPGEPRWALTPAVAFILEKRFQKLGFSGPVGVEGDACPLLVLEHWGSDPRKMLVKARQARAQLAAPLEPGELSPFVAIQRQEATRWAVDPQGVAVAAVLRLGWNQPLGPLLYPVEPAPAAVEALLRDVVLNHAGQAEIWERERRSPPPTVQVLPSGVLLSVRESPSDVGVVAVAFSGLGASAGQHLAEAMALASARKGLPSQVVVGLGMAAAAVAGSPDDLVEVLEDLVAEVSRPLTESPQGGALARALAAVGVGAPAAGENVGVVLELPENSEHVAEAAEKFLSALPSGKVAALPQLVPGLTWQAGDGNAEVAAVVELPATLEGAVAAEVLLRRLASQGVQAGLQKLAGKLVLVFWGSGEASVPIQDQLLATAWEQALLVSPEEVGKVWEALSKRFLGSWAQAAARRAMGMFFPALDPGGWVAPEVGAVRSVVGALPSYKALPRFAVGPRATGEEKKR